MAQTLIEKILSTHRRGAVGEPLHAGDTADIEIDIRAARDFGGASVVKNLHDHGLRINDSTRTFFTFDCNPTGSDQGYATNQHICRMFARENEMRLYDINCGIGTHIAIDDGLVGPGGTFVSTDSHANILGAIGAFGQGMGDLDVAHAFSRGTVWFDVPQTVKVVFKGKPSPLATAKDIGLLALKRFGAHGLLGFAAEFSGHVIDSLNLSGRITIASLATEMGAIAILFPPSKEIIKYCKSTGAAFEPLYPDDDATYAATVEIDVTGLVPLISRPGHPEDVVPVDELEGTPVDSVFIGSCTNGRYEDLKAAATILHGRKVAPGVILKIVPATDKIWHQCLKDGLIKIFKDAGALVSNAGCAGCAAGQVGQNGPGEVTISTGNRNFAGKQGKGRVYLASPETAAASAVAGAIVAADEIPPHPFTREIPLSSHTPPPRTSLPQPTPAVVKGRVWIIMHDNIDTDMIFHNKHLAVTSLDEMGKYTFASVEGLQAFAPHVKPGDIIITGANFGCGSSRQQAVDCFRSLGVGLVIAKSFGSIYHRNAINSGMPVLIANLSGTTLKNGDIIEADLSAGTIKLPDGQVVTGKPFSSVQMEIYKRGGLLANER